MNRDFESGLVVIIMGILGIVIAFIEYLLYSEGIFIDELVTGTITISDLMIVTILVWVIVGLIIAALK